VQAAGRGGSWNNNHRNARVSDRNNNHPNNQWNNNGFRVVAPHRFASRQKNVLIKVRRRGKTGWPDPWSHSAARFIAV
jgi:hypothetical protein